MILIPTWELENIRDDRNNRDNEDDGNDGNDTATSVSGANNILIAGLGGQKTTKTLSLL